MVIKKQFVSRMLYTTFVEAGYSVEFDQPFKGTLVPLPLVDEPRLLACMLEVRRDVYLDQEAYEAGVVHIDAAKMSRFHVVLGEVRRRLFAYLNM